MSEQELVLRYDDIDTREPVQIIIDAVIKYNIKKLVPLFSGGKDSLVVVKITELAIAKLKEMGIVVEMEVLHCYTGTGAPRNFDYILQMAEKNGWKLVIEWPQDEKEYPQLPYMRFLQEVGFPSHDLHSMVLRILKFESMERYMLKALGSDISIDSKAWQEKVLHGGIWLVSGRGAKNSNKRKGYHDQERKEASFDDLTARIEWNLPFIKPLIRTSKTFVWDFIKKHSLELIDTYAWVHHSLECNCGAQAKKGELKELHTWQDQTDNIATDIDILIDQFGGKYEVEDELGRKYVKDFGYWGWKPKKANRKLDKKQKQLEEIVCWECSVRT